MIAEVPKNGWLVFCVATNEFQIVGPDLDLLARTTGFMIDRARSKYPDAAIFVYELGRQMHISLEYKIAQLEPMTEPEGGSS